jgi:hypothetical protein
MAKKPEKKTKLKLRKAKVRKSVPPPSRLYPDKKKEENKRQCRRKQDEEGSSE